MTLDADMLAAWKAARDVHGHEVSFTQALTSAYDYASGDLLESSGTVSVVNAIICPKPPERGYVHDQAVQSWDLVIQVDGADLGRVPRLGELVEYDGGAYYIAHLTEFTFGVWEIALKGAQECST